MTARWTSPVISVRQHRFHSIRPNRSARTNICTILRVWSLSGPAAKDEGFGAPFGSKRYAGMISICNM